MTGPVHDPAMAGERPVSRRRRFAMIGGLCLTTFLLLGLGSWQVQRMCWKRDLVARVEARIHAPPATPPTRERWSAIDPQQDEYRRLRLSGRFLHAAETQIYAATELGPGYWVVTPLLQGNGEIVLVNRGFVPTERRLPATRLEGQVPGEVTVTGLLRPSEPGGTLLRPNDPAGDRWFSRDVAAIAQARGLSLVAPFVVDADEAPNPGSWPRGGLTRVAFSDNHLVYVLNWYALALLALGALIHVVRGEARPRV